MSEFGDKLIDIGHKAAEKMPASFQRWLLLAGGTCLTHADPRVRRFGGILLLIAPKGSDYPGDLAPPQGSDQSLQQTTGESSRGS